MGAATSVAEPPRKIRRAVPRTYAVYGLTLDSEIWLSIGAAPPAPADITIAAGDAAEFERLKSGLNVFRQAGACYDRGIPSDGSDYLCWPDLFEFIVSADGRRITCHASDRAEREALEMYLLGPVLSFALVKQGKEPLHASVVELNGRAVGFLGPSGQGKSTLAASLIRAGARLVTDDLLLVRSRGIALCASPGPQRVKLFPEAADACDLSSRSSVAMNPATPKLIFELESIERTVEPVPLAALFVLGETARPGEPPHARRLPKQEAFIALVSAAFNGRVTGADRFERQFKAAESLSTRLPVWQLTYERKFSVLEDIRALVLDCAFSPKSSVT
jgi:hypothetical protein